MARKLQQQIYEFFLMSDHAVTDHYHAQPRCPKCSGEMDSGCLQSLYPLAYQSDNRVRYRIAALPVAITQARACYRCGYVECYIDTKTLQTHIAR